MTELEKILKRAAAAAYDAGVEGDADLRLWIGENVIAEPEMLFFVHFLLACQVADLHAQNAGYLNEIDRALKTAKSKIKERHENHGN